VTGVECYCGDLIAQTGRGVWIHVETGSRYCFPDEPDSADLAAPVPGR
jgi:hypothetical protein